MKKYQILYIDPPWQYKNKRTGGSLTSGAAQKYPVMSLDDIKELPIKDICDENAALFLWATTPMLEEGLDVMKTWGFKYKTAIYWRKLKNLGLGYWFRGQVEVCLFGIKGKVKAFRLQIPNFIQSKVGKHSEKPKEMINIINKIELNPKIELFARQKSEGWDALGFEIDGMDIRESLKKLVNT